MDPPPASGTPVPQVMIGAGKKESKLLLTLDASTNSLERQPLNAWGGMEVAEVGSRNVVGVRVEAINSGVMRTWRCGGNV